MLFARVGCDKKGPSILLIFEYINKKDTNFTNIVSKVVTGFCMGLKILLGFTIFEITLFTWVFEFMAENIVILT